MDGYMGGGFHFERYDALQCVAMRFHGAKRGVLR